MKILCDTHSHTIASTHAYSTIAEYAQEAAQKGLKLISITDHGPEMPDAPHPYHFGNMKIVPRIINGVGILRGIESNILNTSGEVDIAERMLPFLDFAIASFHEPVFAPSTRADHTRAMISTICSGKVQIIGHPGNPSFPVDADEVVRAAKDNNVVLEINNSSFLQSRPGSYPFCREILESTLRHDWMVSFSSDAHISYDVGGFDQSMLLAAETGLTEDRIINATPQRFLAFLKEHGRDLNEEYAAIL